MELPHLGQHCSEITCKQLDFLPMKCDACGEIFCKNHILYAQHHCKASYKKNIQVPVCPLCNQPVPVNRNELPDTKVGQHMDQDCQSTTAKDKRKNKCAATSCKKKELIPIKCDHCKLSFCLKHRHPLDHNCQHWSSNSPSISNAGHAAMARSKSKHNSKSNTKTENSANQYSNNFVTSMSEDEALARALQLSLLDEPSVPKNPHVEDLQLAQAIAASEEQYSKEKRNTSCNVS